MAKQRKKTAVEESSSKKKQEETKNSLPEQLNRAEAAVVSNQQTALTLHRQWRTHLLRMSYMVILVTLHQAQSPTTACVQEIKHWNELKRNSMEDTITGWQTFVAVVHDSVSEIAAIVCACFLMQCLSLPIMTDHNDFSTLSYRLSCACIPVIISIYAARNQNTTMGGCLGTTEGSLLEYTMENQPPPHKPHGFPVILVFHSIVSLSLFFMQYQSKQAEINIEKVRKLKKDLTETRTFKKKK